MNDAQTESIQGGETTTTTNVPVGNGQQPTLEQLQASGARLTPEQEEEIKLRNKYPNPQKPGGSAFIQKMLHKGSKKYFDSGDYNMAKSKSKALNGNKATLPTSGMVASCNDHHLGSPQPPTSSSSSTHEFNSPPAIVLDTQTSTTPAATESIAKTPSFNNGHHQQQQQQLHTPLASNNNISNTSNSPLSTSISSVSILNNYLGVGGGAAGPQLMSSSLSSQSISMISSSLSTDKLSSIQINAAVNPSCMLDSEEIGHGIPTPECLPQSRKHSIVQSKLATPRLSST